MADETPSIQFCFDYISPYSYLAATQVRTLAERLDIPVTWQPLNLPRLIKLSGNLPPSTIRNKARYLLRDLKQMAAHLNVPFHMILPGAFDSRPAIAATQALNGADREEMARAVFDGLWADGIDYRREDWLAALLAAKGLPADRVLDADAYSQQMQAINDATAAAYKTGAFGVPTFFLQGMGRRQLFWGVDRMNYLERVVAQIRAGQ